MRAAKQWCIAVVSLTALILLICGGATAIVDPFFHYHAPLEALEYPMDSPRYQNDGIVRNFTYDAIITGSSMTENFCASELDMLFDVNTVKVPLNGGSLKEVNDLLQRAVLANPDIKMVVRSLDIYMLLWDKDDMREFDYPYYLYDNNLLNDVSYLLNKDTFFDHTLKVFEYTKAGNKTIDFDTYRRWAELYEFGGKAVLSNFERADRQEGLKVLSENRKEMLRENVVQNIISLARSNPDIQFYYYYPPYCILYWENIEMDKRTLQALEIASEMILECENIHLFSFLSSYETITDLNNYKDTQHHTAEINSLILQSMRNDEYRLTPEDNRTYWKELEEYLCAFDFDAFLDEQGYVPAKRG